MRRFTIKTTKATLLEAYNELAEELQALKTSTPSSAGNLAVAVDETSTDPYDIALSLQTLASRFGLSANDLQRSLTEETKKLQELQLLRKEREDQLNKLHGIEFLPETVDRLITEYLELCEASKLEIEDLKASQSADLSTNVLDWEQKKKEFKETDFENQRQEKIEDQRRIEKVDYDKKIRTEKEEDDVDQQKLGFDESLDISRGYRRTIWLDKETELKAREEELKDLRQQAVTIPVKLAKMTRNAEEAGVSIARRQAQGEIELSAKEQEGKDRIHKLTVESLSKTLQEQQIRVTSLSSQLTIATGQAQDLAVKAIDGASNEKSFTAINKIALEQAKVSTKGK